MVPISGAQTPKYVTDNAFRADVELSVDDLAKLDAVPLPEGGRYD